VYAGVGKTEEEIRAALKAEFSCSMWNQETSSGDRQDCRADEKKGPDRAKINPDINPKTHPYISTG